MLAARDCNEGAPEHVCSVASFFLVGSQMPVADKSKTMHTN